MSKSLCSQTKLHVRIFNVAKKPVIFSNVYNSCSVC